jgi:cell division protein FtsL
VPASSHARIYPVWLPSGSPRRHAAARRRTRIPATALVATAIVIITVPSLLYVAQLAHRAEAGYTILRLQREVADLRAEHARLLMRVATLKSPRRIEQIATTQLGMVPPGQRQLAAIALRPVVARLEPSDSRGSVIRTLTSWLGRSEAQARERLP